MPMNNLFIFSCLEATVLQKKPQNLEYRLLITHDTFYYEYFSE